MPSNERSAEYCRGAVAALEHQSHFGAATLLSHYRALLAAAEAREATQPTAAEVIEAAEEALEKSSGYVSAFENLYKCAWGDAGMCKSEKDDLTATEDGLRAAAAIIARWKEANGGK